jgi:nifR3 family TIM-barrel protein
VLPAPVFLAPMAGYTDSAFRSLCLEFGCGMVFTEVVNARGVVHDNRRTLFLLESRPPERPCAAHLYGAEPDILAEAARRVEQTGRFDAMDFNCGCPVPKIVAKGAGAALLKDPGKIERLVRAIREAVSLPVTVKTRIGFDAVNIGEVGAAIEAGGADAVFVHARLAVNRHAGPADWETLARMKAGRRIPVVGNGGVAAAEDVLTMLRQTGVDGVMIGRAAVGNPWIFREVADLLAGRPVRPHTVAEHRCVILSHLDRMVQSKQNEAKFSRRRSPPAQAAPLEFRGHLVRYLMGCPGWNAVRRDLEGMTSVEAVRAAVETAFAGLPDSALGLCNAPKQQFG